MNRRQYTAAYRKIYGKDPNIMLVFTDMSPVPREFDVDNCVFPEEVVKITRKVFVLKPIIGLFF